MFYVLCFLSYLGWCRLDTTEAPTPCRVPDGTDAKQKQAARKLNSMKWLFTWQLLGKTKEEAYLALHNLLWTCASTAVKWFLGSRPLVFVSFFCGDGTQKSWCVWSMKRVQRFLTIGYNRYRFCCFLCGDVTDFWHVNSRMRVATPDCPWMADSQLPARLLMLCEPNCRLGGGFGASHICRIIKPGCQTKMTQVDTICV